jgi:glutathionyl-hydroquinone reductase
MVEGLEKKNTKRPEQKKNNPKPKKESPWVVPIPSEKKVSKVHEEAPKSTTTLKKNVAPGFPNKTKYSLYVCLGCPHDTYIATKMEIIKETMLYYISNIVTTDLTLLQSIAETILYLLFGSPYSTRTVDWGYTRLVLLELHL